MLRDKTGNFEIKTVSIGELDLLYPDKERDAERGLIGYLRADFGHNGKEFWMTWFDRCGELKTQVFKDELDAVINHLREDGNILNSLTALTGYCRKHPDALLTVKYRTDTYGFKIDTEAHSYYIRGMLTQGDYYMVCCCYLRERLEQSLAAAQSKKED